jgi:NagD protein
MSGGLLLDMDGVIYRGSELIDGARDFVRSLIEHDVPFRFLTNNSQRTRRDVATKLQRLGLPVESYHIYTCSMATARFLSRQTPGGTAYVIGEGGLMTALHHNGFAIVDKDPDYVVVGEGRTLSFEQIETALRMILAGARLVATNLDPNCPTDKGMRPGCGATVAMLETAAGVKAFSVGKPSPFMLSDACIDLGLPFEKVVMVGDTMSTDILGAVQLGLRSVLVLTGCTKPEDLAEFAYKPDLIVDSIANLDFESLSSLWHRDVRFRATPDTVEAA